MFKCVDEFVTNVRQKKKQKKHIFSSSLGKGTFMVAASKLQLGIKHEEYRCDK